MRIVVLGAGVVGVATAWFLNRDGHEVVVLDRQPGPALETSFANGGQISANHTTPWAGPATPLKALKWLGRADAPLRIRPRLDRAQWAWLARFLRNCTAARMRRHTERALRLALLSRATLAELRVDTGIRYDELGLGILHVFRDRREFDLAVPQAELMDRAGCRRQVLDPDACVAREPALAAARGDLVGGIISPDDESGDAHLFTARLAEDAAARGVEFRFGTRVEGLRTEHGRVAAVDTCGGAVGGDRYVLAMGSYSPLLLRPLGIRLPVYPAKGYSVTLSVSDPGKAPSVSLIDDEHKLVYSRLGDRLRVAGMAELMGHDTRLDPTRAKAVLDQALGLFPGCADPASAEFWCGLRPKTPDSVPVIGETPLENLWLNTGHGTLGWTMACGSARVIADLIAGRAPPIDLEGLGLARF